MCTWRKWGEKEHSRWITKYVKHFEYGGKLANKETEKGQSGRQKEKPGEYGLPD